MKEELAIEQVRTVLHDGDEIKNYPALCALLEQSVKSGASKRAQTHDWLRFFDWEKKGQKYVINEVYEHPLPKPARKSDVYASLIEYCLAATLAKEPGYKKEFTKYELYQALYMVNGNYGKWRYSTGSDVDFKPIEFKSTVDFESNEYKINSWEVNRFYNTAGFFLSGVLDRALRSLQNYRGMIKYREVTKIVYHEMEEYIDENGNPAMRPTLETFKRNATDEEEQFILKIRQKVMREMGISTIPQIYFSNRGKEFYEKVNEKLRAEKGWCYTHEAYDIIYNQEYMEIRLPEVQKSVREIISLFGIPLNKVIMEGLNHTIDNTGKNGVAKTKSGMYWGNKNPMKLPSAEAITRQKLLSELLVRVAPSLYDETYPIKVELDKYNNTDVI